MIPGRDWPFPALSRGWLEGPGAPLPGGVDPHTAGHTQPLGTVPSIPYQGFRNICLVNLNLYIDLRNCTLRTRKQSFHPLKKNAGFFNLTYLFLQFGLHINISEIWIPNSKRYIIVKILKDTLLLKF